MTQTLPADTEVAGWLHTLGVTSLCQWDVLVFLYRHQATLLGAAHLARLLGYATEPIVAALDVPRIPGACGHARGSRRGSACTSASSRSIPRTRRLLHGSRPSPTTAPVGYAWPSSYGGLIAPLERDSTPAKRFHPEAQQGLRVVRQQVQPLEDRRAPWLKAI